MENMENKIPDTTPVPEEVKPAEPEVKTEKAETNTKSVNPKPAAPENEQNTKFALTVKQVWTVIKGFFSKNIVDCMASQYNSAYPIWAILLPAYVLLGAASATATFNSTRDTSLVLNGAFPKADFGAGEVFFITLATSIVTSLVFILGIRAFIKFHKGDGHFANSANLYSAVIIPITMFYLLNIITGGTLSFIITPLTQLATLAMYMMLFSGISAQIGGKKPLWSFFLMLIIVSAVTVIITMVVISPIILSNFAYSFIDNLTQAMKP